MADERPDTRHLQCFVAAAEIGSIRRAAQRLGLAQPTVTGHIHRLEAILGFHVFDRVGRKVVLTEQGTLLLPRAQRALRAIDEVAQGVSDDVEAGVGRLAIGAIPTMSPYLLPPVLATLRSEYPDCELVLFEELTESLIDRLDDHSIEVALLSPPVNHPRIECETLGVEDLLIVASDSDQHDVPDRITLKELRRHSRISLNEMHCLGTQIENFCARKGLQRHTSCHTTQLETVLQLVRLGLGISLVPAMAAQRRSSQGLRYTRLRRDAPQREVGVATKVGRSKSVLADRFAALVELEVRKIAAQSM